MMFGKRKAPPPDPGRSHAASGLPAPAGVHDDAERAFAEIYGSALVAQQRMFIVAAGALVVAVASVAALFQVANNNVAIPFLVEVAPGVGVVNKPVRVETIRPSQAVLKAELARWAVKVFTIDSVLSPQLLREANAMTMGLGEAQFTEFRVSQGVIERMTKDPTLQRIPTVTSIDTSQEGVAFIFVQTKEARGNTAVASTAQYRLTVKYEFIPPASEAAIMANPLGLFITSLNVSEEGKVK
jgi:type IV secretory pathway TrbF-like protein